jgi:hypothetical protein
MIVEMPDGFRGILPTDDGKSEISAMGDRRIKFADEESKINGFAMMDHLEDSLSDENLAGNGRGRTVPPQYPGERSPRAQLKFDKYRPQDPNLLKLN